MSATATAEKARPLKPHALLVDPEAIPQELKDLVQWVNWRYEPNDKQNDWTKVPKNPKAALNGRDSNASTTNAKTWGTFDQAWAAYQMHPPMVGDVPMPNDPKSAGNNGLDGIGLVLGADNPYCGVDLDKCLKDGQLTSEDAREALELLSGTYMEISPSGTGIRVFCVATKPGTECKTGTREMYDKNGGRFLTLTGHTYGEPCGITEKQEPINALYAQWFTKETKTKTTSGASTSGATKNVQPSSSGDDELLLERMFASKHGAAIKALWNGDTSAYATDKHDGISEGDLALAAHLGWWCDYDLARVDKLYRQSALYRPKWDELRGKQTYGLRTIAKAFEGKGRGDGYNGENNNDIPNDDGLTWGKLQELPPNRPPARNMIPALVPEALRPWLVDAAERMSARLELLTVPALVCLGALFGRKVVVRPQSKNTSWTEPLNLWGAAVSPPSSLKTPALNEATSHIHALAGEAMKTFNEGAANREAQLELARMELADLKKGDKKGKKTTPEQLASVLERITKLEAENHPQRYIVNDSTTEKIAELLIHNPDGLLVQRDELVGLLKSFDKTGREGDRDFYLEAWGGKNPFFVDRIGRGSLHVPAVCLSVIGTTQPGRFEKYIDEAIEGGEGADGLLQRFQLLVWPDDQPDFVEVDRDRDHEAYNRARRVYRGAADFNPTTYPGIMHSGLGGELPSISFAEDAQQLFSGWRNDLMQRIRGPEFKQAEGYQGHLGKYPGFVAKLALLFHLTEYLDGRNTGGPISLKNAELAIQWVTYLDHHARKVYAAELQQGRQAMQMLAAALEGGKIKDKATLKSIYDKQLELLGTKKELVEAIEQLEQYGWVQRQKGVSGSQGGRPTEVLRIHPGLEF